MPNLGNFRFRSKTESGDKESAYERRRSQVRKAQRNHRERKENYIKALEAEVIKLRNFVQEDSRDIAQLISVIERCGAPLPNLESAHRPPESEQPYAGPINSKSEPEGPYLTVQRPGKKKPLRIERIAYGGGHGGAGLPSSTADPPLSGMSLSPGFKSESSGFSSSSTPLGSDHGLNQGAGFSPVHGMQRMDISPNFPPQQPAFGGGNAPGDFDFNLSSQQQGSGSGLYNSNANDQQFAGGSGQQPPRELAQTSKLDETLDNSVGMDFVLSLEHPCMGHLDEARRSAGTHSHMASSHLLGYAPASMTDNTTNPVSWDVPLAPSPTNSGPNQPPTEQTGSTVADTGIERLLALSSTFQLEGEITPVQAWFRVKNDPRFSMLQHGVKGTDKGAIGRTMALERLERLRRLLWGDVKCYGFGAVMDEKIFEIGVEEALSGIPPA